MTDEQLLEAKAKVIEADKDLRILTGLINESVARMAQVAQGDTNALSVELGVKLALARGRDALAERVLRRAGL